MNISVVEGVFDLNQYASGPLGPDLKRALHEAAVWDTYKEVGENMNLRSYLKSHARADQLAANHTHALVRSNIHAAGDAHWPPGLWYDPFTCLCETMLVSSKLKVEPVVNSLHNHVVICHLLNLISHFTAFVLLFSWENFTFQWWKISHQTFVIKHLNFHWRQRSDQHFFKGERISIFTCGRNHRFLFYCFKMAKDFGEIEASVALWLFLLRSVI